MPTDVELLEKAMTIESDYRKYVTNKIPNLPCHIDTLIWLTTGLVTESSELLDIIRKVKFMSKGNSISPIILEAINDEIGDILWYFYAIMIKCGFHLQYVMEDNISKLDKRMPSGEFSLEEHWTRFIKKLEEKYK